MPARYSDEAPLHQASPGVSGGPAAKLQGPLAMMLHMDLLACVALLKDDVYMGYTQVKPKSVRYRIYSICRLHLCLFPGFNRPPYTPT